MTTTSKKPPAESSPSETFAEGAEEQELVTIVAADGATYLVPKTIAVKGRKEPESEKEREFYIHLADGSVEKIAASEVPQASGTNAPYGYWQKDGDVLLVIGVYPAS